MLEQGRLQVPALASLDLRYLYLVQLSAPLSADKTERLISLIGATSNVASSTPAASVDPRFCATWLVTPRIGTQSSWSSKATSIGHNCGFDQLMRIERVKRYRCVCRSLLQPEALMLLTNLWHDRMTESVLTDPSDIEQLFTSEISQEAVIFPLLEQGGAVLDAANRDLHLSLSDAELQHLEQAFMTLGRNPSDVELMTFAQVNSEHCRHKIFNAAWRGVQNKKAADVSLFAMIKNTWHATNGEGVLSAYSDNAAVLEGACIERLMVDPANQHYAYRRENAPILIKVETHNHPTAISPFAGAATGAGGEMRDESAVGCGSAPKAGLVGYSVSNLQLPDVPQPWHKEYGRPDWIASPLQIMLEAPIGAAAFNNEFGRPNLLGYFRTFEMQLPAGVGGKPETRGYHKPIMLAGGLGSVRPNHIEAADIAPGDLLVVLGGPAMLIGLGGGAASSRAAGSADAEYDFASVQRDNAEMQRRCQGVIDSCCALDADNPVLCIHDVGAGGLSNALPELVQAGGVGGHIHLDAIPVADQGMSPLQIWCNESQERYVLAIRPADAELFADICRRERCPFACVGEAVAEPRMTLVRDAPMQSATDNAPKPCLDLPLATLFDDLPKQQCFYKPASLQPAVFAVANMQCLEEAIERVLSFPAVAAKMFLITIGDRTVGGLVARDQLVGPWQVPVADVAVTLQGYRTYAGEAFAIGERPPVALLDAAAAARLAVAEALTNLAAADVRNVRDVKLSANWMAAVDHPGEAAKLHDAVTAIGMELCPALGMSIPVGKDSLSMQTLWQDDKLGERAVISPVTLNISAFAAVPDVRATLTPELRADADSVLVLLDLAGGKQRLAGSVLTQVYSALDHASGCPDLENPATLSAFFDLMARHRHHILAYHDRSDGGLLTTLAEMSFAGRVGFKLCLPEDSDPVSWLFNEELGAVVQINKNKLQKFYTDAENLNILAYEIGHPDTASEDILICQQKRVLIKATRANWQKTWWSVSHCMQRLRDHPDCADAELATISAELPGLSAKLPFDANEDVAADVIQKAASRPKVLILREQGVNGHVEMAAAFDAAGFAPVDVHMTDLAVGAVQLQDFRGLAICGGFSYGDVLGAGTGWAKAILYNSYLRDEFSAWFSRDDCFTLGVCNGCQMLSELREIIAGAEHWPHFAPNASEQFEARLSLVEVADNPTSMLLAGMEGAVLPVAVAHGEGRAVFAGAADMPESLCILRYVDQQHRVTCDYPFNPNGSYAGIAGLTTPNGLVTAMMPHPERMFRTVQHSWHPAHWQEDGPWLRLFRNARVWIRNS